MSQVDRSKFFVAKHQCDECLFTKNRVVRRGRMKEMINDCMEQQTHFVCHKFTLAADTGEDVAHANTCCRGFWDAFPGNSVPMRLAVMWDLVEFVDVPGEEKGSDDVTG